MQQAIKKTVQSVIKAAQFIQNQACKEQNVVWMVFQANQKQKCLGNMMKPREKWETLENNWKHKAKLIYSYF